MIPAWAQLNLYKPCIYVYGVRYTARLSALPRWRTIRCLRHYRETLVVPYSIATFLVLASCPFAFNHKQDVQGIRGNHASRCVVFETGEVIVPEGGAVCT